MLQERKLKKMIFQVLISVVLCLTMIAVKFVWKEDGIIEEIYNYLITDIVFLLKI